MRPLSLRTQLVVAIGIPSVLVLGGVILFADEAMRDALEDSLGAQLVATAQAAATVVDPKITLLERGDDELRTARSAQKKLERLTRARSAERILIVRLAPTEVLLDSSGALSIGAEYLRAGFDRAELDGVRAGESVASALFQGPDGTYYKTGYAPLRAEDESVVAAVVVHAPASFFDVLGRLRGVLAALFALGVLVIAVLATLSARAVTEPLSLLSRSAERIGKGELDAEIPSGGPLEARVLSDTMRSMARSIAEREEEMQVMLAGIAHEVRNPLSGIELFGGLLKEDLEEGDPRRRSVDKILKQIGVLTKVVNDFLDFARKRALDKRPLDLAELLEEIAQVIAPDAKAKGVSVEVEAERGLVALLDRDPMQRAVLNLAKNAVQAVKDGGKLRLCAAPSGDRLELRVVDDGPGIPVEARADVFRPFFTTKQRGTGLGLALVKKTVDGHGGAIRIEETPGGGATFVLSFARAADDGRAQP